MSDGTPRVKRRWRPRPIKLIAAALIYVGMLLLMYTPVASWFSHYSQSKLIQAYNSEASPPSGKRPNPALKVAYEYNAQLAAGAEIEANTNVPKSHSKIEGLSTPYDDILTFGPTGMMARIRIPSIDVDLPIFHGTSDATLLRGAGHLEGTSLPVGGVSTHSVITAHRGLANATMFTNLNTVTVGDVFFIEVAGELLTYQVRTTQVVAPEDTESLRAVEGKDLVTLVTCTPLGINTHRILVTAERIPNDPDAAAQVGKRPDIPRFPWWVLILAAGTLTIGAYVWFSGLTRVEDLPVRSPRRGYIAPRRAYVGEVASSMRN